MIETSNEVIDLCVPSEEISISDGSSPDSIQIVTSHRDTKYSVVDDIQKVITSKSFSSMHLENNESVTSESQTIKQSMVTSHTDFCPAISTKLHKVTDNHDDNRDIVTNLNRSALDLTVAEFS